MSGSQFGKNFSIATFGESHGPAIGVVIDGCPAGLKLSLTEIAQYMRRRKPGQTEIASTRQEQDTVEILSGVFEGYTTGTPIALLIRNTDHRSSDYETLRHVYRPSHADYTYAEKYGCRDYRGGGRASARETAARVAAGSIAKQFLKALGIEVTAYTQAIGPISVPEEQIDLHQCQENLLAMPNNLLAQEALSYIAQTKQAEDAIGGVVGCLATGLPVGLGEPVYRKLDALLGQAIMSINAVKAFEIGAGFAASRMKSSEYNDIFYNDQGHVKKRTNHSGGMLGGLSDGSPLLLRAHFKPTPSIAKPQPTLTTSLEDTTIAIKGRHDPTVVPRAAVVVEAMTALVLADLMLELTHSSMTRIRQALGKE
jgi:chorismate synthase